MASVVGTGGFEPPAPCSQSRCATRLRHVPAGGVYPTHGGFWIGGSEPKLMTLTTVLFHDGRCRPEPLPFEQISDVLAAGSDLVWVDVVLPTEEEIQQLAEEFSLPPLAVEDALEAHQRPKIDRYQNCLFAVAYGAAIVDGGLQLSEVGLFAAPHFAITVRHQPALNIDRVGERLQACPKELSEGGGFVMYVVFDHIVDGYFEALEYLQDRIVETEERLLTTTSGDGDLPAVFRLRHDIVRFRRAVAPLREVLNTLLRRDETVLDPALDEHFRDLSDHVIKVYEELDMGRELLATAVEGHMSVVSNRLNNVVLKVSAWAAIIAVPTFIASVYGMNFRHMPELHWTLGYPFAGGLMLAVGGLLYALFHRRDWL